jgi:hypothetical protein
LFGDDATVRRSPDRLNAQATQRPNRWPKPPSGRRSAADRVAKGASSAVRAGKASEKQAHRSATVPVHVQPHLAVEARRILQPPTASNETSDGLFFKLLCTILRLSGHSIVVPCWAAGGDDVFRRFCARHEAPPAQRQSESARGWGLLRLSACAKNEQLGRISGIGGCRQG